MNCIALRKFFSKINVFKKEVEVLIFVLLSMGRIRKNKTLIRYIEKIIFNRPQKIYIFFNNILKL